MRFFKSIVCLGILGLIGAANQPKAVVGEPAPDFTLRDLSGKDIALSDYKGQTVVLEWINPVCPFVHRQYKLHTMSDLIKKYPNVAWLRIATGKSANAAQLREFATQEGITGPILLDAAGQVGQTYGATNTPDMYVIDKAGTLRYAGAIDSQPTAESDEPIHADTIRYVDQALQDLRSDRPIAHSQTKPYGCWIKYAD